MTWFILFVGVVMVCFIAALVLGLIGGGSTGGLGAATRSLSHEPLPDDAIADSDFDDLVFDVGLRGYRMSQVDGVVDRLRRELREKDEEIAVLRGGAPEALGAQAASGVPGASAAPSTSAAPNASEARGASEPPEATDVSDGSEPLS